MATETNATMEVDSDDGDDASLNFGSDSGNEEIDTEKSSSDDGKENATPEVDAKSDTGSKSKRENSDQASAGSSEVTIGDDEGPNKGSGGGSSSSSKRQKTSVVDAQGNITCDVSTMGHAQLLAMVVKQQEEMKKMREQLSKKNSSSSSKKKTPSKPKTPRNKSMKVIENNMERLDDLDLESKKKALDSIGIDNERELANAQGLQILLWELGCNYCLQAHQFLAVRAIAVGISDHEFPGPIDLATADAKQATKVLKNSPWRLSNKGFLIGDVMGLGKTVEAVAGAMLRNAIAKAHKKVEKPTLICTPNEAVLGQWVETFIKAGIDKNKLYRYKTKQTDPFQGDIFVLCTIYDLQTEARYCFNRPNHQSPLFPTAPKYLLRVLRNQYKAERGRAKNMYARKGESINGVIRSYLNKYESQCSLTFRTFIFDEAHFARNLTTFWGSAAAMIGLHSECVLPMSGTPYNNRLQDIATLMTFVNPRHASARESWWKQATKNKSASTVLEKVKEWNENYLIRRGKDVLARQLPPKEIRKAIITLSETEVANYDANENKLIMVLKALRNAFESNDRLLMKECLKRLFMLVASAMLVTAHPILPNGGRDVTVLFSPSRGKVPSILKAQEKRKTCVCCYRTVAVVPRRTKEDTAQHGGDGNHHRQDANTSKDQMAGDKGKKRTTKLDVDVDEACHAMGSEEKNDDSDEQGTPNSQITKNERKNSDTSKKEPPTKARKNGLFLGKRARKAWIKSRSVLSKHVVDTNTMDSEYEDSDGEMENDHVLDDVSDNEQDSDDEDEFDDGDDVDDVFDFGDKEEGVEYGRGEILPFPRGRCQTASKGIVHYACETCLEKYPKCPRCENLVGRLRTMATKHRESAASDTAWSTDKHNLRDRVFCPDIFGGFQASSKLKAIVGTFDKIPSNEKALVTSFYKGGLDLLERMFVDLYPSMEVARFDGDVDVAKREAALQQFRTSARCRVLLMTVKTGGVGLNLVEANHVLFLDRNWNPMVLEQCEDRCYRIGQKKKVTIVYHDAKGTIDQAMAKINESKATNAGIVLADGPALTANPTFINTAGLLGKELQSVRASRPSTDAMTTQKSAEKMTKMAKASATHSVNATGVPNQANGTESSLGCLETTTPITWNRTTDKELDAATSIDPDPPSKVETGESGTTLSDNSADPALPATVRAENPRAPNDTASAFSAARAMLFSNRNSSMSTKGTAKQAINRIRQDMPRPI